MVIRNGLYTDVSLVARVFVDKIYTDINIRVRAADAEVNNNSGGYHRLLKSKLRNHIGNYICIYIY